MFPQSRGPSMMRSIFSLTVFLISTSVFAEGWDRIDCKSSDGRYRVKIETSGPTTFNTFQVWKNGQLAYSYLDLGGEHAKSSVAQIKQALNEFGSLNPAQINQFATYRMASIESPFLGYTDSRIFTEMKLSEIDFNHAVVNSSDGESIADLEYTKVFIKNNACRTDCFDFKVDALLTIPSLKVNCKPVTCTGSSASD